MSQAKIESLIEMYTGFFSEHVLQPPVILGDVEVYTMKRPDSRSYLTQITFTPEGIALQGDVRFGNTTGLLCAGYNRAWFEKSLSWDYIAGKFGFDVYSRLTGDKQAAIAMLAAVHQMFRRLVVQPIAQPVVQTPQRDSETNVVRIGGMSQIF